MAAASRRNLSIPGPPRPKSYTVAVQVGPSPPMRAPDEPELPVLTSFHALPLPTKKLEPEVWIRLSPPLSPQGPQGSGTGTGDFGGHGCIPKKQKQMFQAGEGGRKFHIITERTSQSSKMETWLTFGCTGTLQPGPGSQEETYHSAARGVVRRAMEDGVSGMVLAIGPEACGKSFTLFGNLKQYDDRGIIPRALETLFAIVAQNQKEVAYTVRMAVVEVRGNRLNDLLPPATTAATASRSDPGGSSSCAPSHSRLGHSSGDYGSESGSMEGVGFQEIRCVEHGLFLLMLALYFQKYSRGSEGSGGVGAAHTIVYLEIEGEHLLVSEQLAPTPKKFKSRLTFAKIASLPNRSDDQPKTPAHPEKPTAAARCTTAESAMPCGHYQSSAMREKIAIRKDMFLLQQMFTRVHQLQRIDRLYSKLKNLGMSAFMNKPKLTPIEYFHQSKLAYCIQDIVKMNVEVRILCNFRLEEKNLHPILEALRFTEAAKSISRTEGPAHGELSAADKSESLRHELATLLRELEMEEKASQGQGRGHGRGSRGSTDRPPKKKSEPCTKTRKRIYDAAAFLNGKLKEIEIVNTGQVKAMFETLRAMWNYASDEQRQLAQGEKVKEEPPAIEAPPPPAPEVEEPPPPPSPGPSPPPPPPSATRSSARQLKKAKGKKSKAPKGQQKTSRKGGVKKPGSSQTTILYMGSKEASGSGTGAGAGEAGIGTEPPNQDSGMNSLKSRSGEGGGLVGGVDEVDDGQGTDEGDISNQPPLLMEDAWKEFMLADSPDAAVMLENIKKTGDALALFATEYEHHVAALKSAIEQDPQTHAHTHTHMHAHMHTFMHTHYNYNQTDRRTSGGNDELAKVSNMEAVIQAELIELERTKHEFVSAFNEFCTERYGSTYRHVEFPEDFPMEILEPHLQAAHRGSAGAEAEPAPDTELAVEEHFDQDHHDLELQKLAQSYHEMSIFASKYARTLLLENKNKQRPAWRTF